MPEEADGSVDMKFTFDASALNKKSVVVFEKVYADETEVAAMKNLRMTEQTVKYKIGKVTVDMPGQAGRGTGITRLRRETRWEACGFVRSLWLHGCDRSCSLPQEEAEAQDEGSRKGKMKVLYFFFLLVFLLFLCRYEARAARNRNERKRLQTEENRRQIFTAGPGSQILVEEDGKTYEFKMFPMKGTSEKRYLRERQKVDRQRSDGGGNCI